MSHVPIQGLLSLAVLVVTAVVPGISERKPRVIASAVWSTGPLPAAAGWSEEEEENPIV